MRAVIAIATVALAALVSPLDAQTRPAQTPAALKVTRAIVSESEDGPALAQGAVFLPGEMLFFSFQVENYRMGLTGKVQLTGHIQAFDPAGTPKIRLPIQLPSIAPPGNYTIRFEALDQQSHQTDTGEVAFPMGGKGVERSPALAIRNPGFYRAAEDATPLKIAAYRP